MMGVNHSDFEQSPSMDQLAPIPVIHIGSWKGLVAAERKRNRKSS